MNPVESLERLSFARDEAYVTALLKKESGITVVGTLGWVPAARLWAAGAWPIPIMSQDDSTLGFTSDIKGPLCAPLRATIGYAKTDKCPLIHASSVIAINTACERREVVLPFLRDKTILRFDPVDYEAFDRSVEEEFGPVEPEALETAEHRLIVIRMQLEVLSAYVSTGQLSVREWVIIQNGVRFIPALEEQEKILREWIETAKSRPQSKGKALDLTYVNLDGVDPALWDRLDQQPGYALHTLACEELPTSKSVTGLPLLQEDCIHTERNFPAILNLSDLTPNALLQIQEWIHTLQEEEH